jgi:hypothetical protein
MTMEKIKKLKGTVELYASNLTDILDAITLSVTTIFSAWYGWNHRHDDIKFTILFALAAYAIFQAFHAWSKVLSKKSK